MITYFAGICYFIGYLQRWVSMTAYFKTRVYDRLSIQANSRQRLANTLIMINYLVIWSSIRLDLELNWQFIGIGNDIKIELFIDYWRYIQWNRKVIMQSKERVTKLHLNNIELKYRTNPHSKIEGNIFYSKNLVPK